MKIIFICSIISLLILCGDSYAEEVRVGTTFSQVQCEYLGLDWRHTYQEVLMMKIDILRIGAYWSRIEQKKDVFDFSELDWQVQKAKEKNIPILLTVGMKAPRWPEFFIPDWLTQDIDFRFGSAISDNNSIAERNLIFIDKVIRRYKDEKIIAAWQVENEPLSRAGPKELWIRKDFLQKEIDLVRKLDNKKRSIVVNAMTYLNSFLRFLTILVYAKNPVYETIEIAPVPALNVYPAIGHKVVGQKICFWTNHKGRVDYLKRFAGRAKLLNKSLWVTELQAEPWEPGELVHKRKEDAITCGTENFIATYEELRSLNINTIFLWGAEYWIYRKDQHQDNTWIEAFNQIVSKN